MASTVQGLQTYNADGSIDVNVTSHMFRKLGSGTVVGGTDLNIYDDKLTEIIKSCRNPKYMAPFVLFTSRVLTERSGIVYPTGYSLARSRALRYLIQEPAITLKDKETDAPYIAFVYSTNIAVAESYNVVVRYCWGGTFDYGVFLNQFI